MDNQKGKEYYQNLYIEYKTLEQKTASRAYDLKSGGEIDAKYISSGDMDDMEKKYEVQKELFSGLDFLSDDQLIELSGDPSFNQKAQDILNKRKMPNTEII